MPVPTCQRPRLPPADPHEPRALGLWHDYLKLLYWDGSGLCLFAKRLEQGRFVWPPIVDGALILTPTQLSLLVEAIDWRRTVAPLLPTRPEMV